MASTPSTSQPPHVSLSRLSSELLALIIKELRDVDLAALQSIRSSSKRLYAIATPIYYRHLTLNAQIVASDAEQRYPRARRHISAYTHHVTVPSNLDPAGISRVISSIQRLFSVRWHYVENDPHEHGLWVPADVLDPQQTRFRETKLFVEDLPLCEFENHLRDAYNRTIPPKLLVSLKLSRPVRTLTTRLGSLKRLLVESSKLQTLHYEGRGQGTSFSFQHDERMPALSHLHLRSYDWNHSTEDVQRHWNFSQIRSLELLSVPVFPFLRSVRFDDFSGIHNLHVDDYSAHLQDQREDATVGLYTLIKNHIRALEVLDITCHTHLFSIDAILVHHRSLQVLRLRDHIGFGDDGRTSPTLDRQDVSLLAQNLTSVHTVELDMSLPFSTQPQFLHVVCKFPALHTLTLHIQTLIQPLEEDRPDVDCDYEAAMQIFRFLVRTKQQIGTPVSWRRITINVGGWRKFMVRRLGSHWRRMNEMGIFAERCFVLERDPGGRLKGREEVCSECNSRMTSPDP